MRVYMCTGLVYTHRGHTGDIVERHVDTDRHWRKRCRQKNQPPCVHWQRTTHDIIRLFDLDCLSFDFLLAKLASRPPNVRQLCQRWRMTYIMLHAVGLLSKLFIGLQCFECSEVSNWMPHWMLPPNSRTEYIPAERSSWALSQTLSQTSSSKCLNSSAELLHWSLFKETARVQVDCSFRLKFRATSHWQFAQKLKGIVLMVTSALQNR